MADESVQNPAEETGPTDEQLAAQFPGQDIAHVRAMLDKMDGKGTHVDPSADAPQPEAAVEYPDYIPAKFRQGTVEEATRKLAESYAVLERSRGRPEQPADEAEAETDEAEAEEPAADETPAAELNLQDVEVEFIQNGEVSEATYAKFAKAGLTRTAVDNYIAGQQALASQLVSRVHNLAGGEAEYSQMLRWAEANWDSRDVDEYDAILTEGNERKIALAVRGLKAAYVEANGTSPNLVKGDGKGPGDLAGFQSKAEMTAAIKDPRYKKDPAYREMVAKKIANGNVW